MAITDAPVEKLEKLTEQCVDLRGRRSEVVEAMLTDYSKGVGGSVRNNLESLRGWVVDIPFWRPSS